MTWIQSLGPFVSWLLQTSWQASLLALFVLLLQRIFRNRLDARWIYALWGLVLIRLLAPSLPESPSSVYHITSVPSSPSAWIESTPISPLQIQIETIVPPAPSLSLPEVLTLCWFVGAIAVALASLALHLRLHRKLRHSRPVEDSRIVELIQSCATELHVSRPPRAVIFPSITSPAVIGLWRPTLLLPADLSSRFSNEELRFIFLHEMAHLKRGDLLVQWLLTFLQIFHWFNPVLWFAFSRIRQDREAATDAMVLAQTGETSRRDYGNTLLKLLEQFEHRNSLAGIVGILENKGPMQKRILHISRFTRGAYRWSFPAAFLLIGAAVFFLTSPLPIQNSQETNETNPNGPIPITIETRLFDRPLPMNLDSMKKLQNDFSAQGSAVIKDFSGSELPRPSVEDTLSDRTLTVMPGTRDLEINITASASQNHFSVRTGTTISETLIGANGIMSTVQGGKTIQTNPDIVFEANWEQQSGRETLLFVQNGETFYAIAVIKISANDTAGNILKPTLPSYSAITAERFSPHVATFRENASATKINAHFDNVPSKEALLTLRKLAEKAGCRFDIKDLDKIPADSKITVDFKNHPLDQCLRSVAYLGGFALERPEDQSSYRVDPSSYYQSFRVHLEAKYLQIPFPQPQATLDQLEKEFVAQGVTFIKKLDHPNLLSAPSVDINPQGFAKIEVGGLAVELSLRPNGQQITVGGMAHVFQEGEKFQQIRGSWSQKVDQQTLLKPLLTHKEGGQFYLLPVLSTWAVDLDGKSFLPFQLATEVVTLSETDDYKLRVNEMEVRIDSVALGDFRCDNLPLSEMAALLEKRIKEKNPRVQDFRVEVREGSKDLPVSLNLKNSYLSEVVSALQEHFQISRQRSYQGTDKGYDLIDSFYQYPQAKAANDFWKKAQETLISAEFKSVPVKTALLHLQKLSSANGFNFQFAGLEKIASDRPISASLKNYPVRKALAAVAYQGGLDSLPDSNIGVFNLQPFSESGHLVQIENQFIKLPPGWQSPESHRKLEKEFLAGGTEALSKLTGSQVIHSPCTVVLQKATTAINIGKQYILICPISVGSDFKIFANYEMPDNRNSSSEWMQKNGQKVLLFPPLERTEDAYLSILSISLLDISGNLLLPPDPSRMTAALKLLPPKTPVSEVKGVSSLSPKEQAQLDLGNAIDQNDLKKASQSLDAGADPNQLQNETHLLSFCVSPEMVDLLVQRGANPKANPNGRSLLTAASFIVGDVKVLEALLQHGAPFETRPIGSDAFVASLVSQNLPKKRSDRIALASFWIGKGVSPNAYSSLRFIKSSVLTAAVREDRTDLIRFLVQQGADPNLKNPDNISPMLSAIMGGNFESAQTLKELGANGIPDLVWYSALGDEGQVSALLKNGGNPNEADSLGQSALYMAVHHARPGIARILLEAGANPNQFSALGYSAWINLLSINTDEKHYPKSRATFLHTTAEDAQKRMGELRQVFKTAPLHLDFRDPSGRTALQQAAWDMNIEIVSEILRAGGNPNMPDFQGKTALLYATESPNCRDLYPMVSREDKGRIIETRNGTSEIVQNLLKAGAKLDLKTGYGMNVGDLALQAAVLAKNQQVAEALLAQPYFSAQARKDRAGKTPSLEIQAHLIEVPITSMSAAELLAFRKAVESNDLGFLMSIKKANSITCPKICIAENQPDTAIDFTQDFRFPSSAEKAPGLPMTPVKFETIPVGVKIEVSAKPQDEGMILSGKLQIRDFEGMTQGENNMGASFDTKESRFNTLLQNGIPKIANQFSSTGKQKIEENGKSRDVLVEKETLLVLTVKKLPL